MKRIWMNMVYSNICDGFLIKTRPERTIDMMEQVLFLMQLESIHKKMKPLLPYPIYIADHQIGIAYISDLLRVGPVQRFYREGWFLYGFHALQVYQTMLAKYRRMTPEEVKQRVEEALKQDLDPRYFINENYQNKSLRRASRLKINTSTHSLLNVLRLLITFAIGMGALVVTMAVGPIAQSKGLPIIEARLFGTLLMGIICFIFGIGWTIYWLKPTKYELALEEEKKDAN